MDDNILVLDELRKSRVCVCVHVCFHKTSQNCMQYWDCVIRPISFNTMHINRWLGSCYGLHYVSSVPKAVWFLSEKNNIIVAGSVTKTQFWDNEMVVAKEKNMQSPQPTQFDNNCAKFLLDFHENSQVYNNRCWLSIP